MRANAVALIAVLILSLAISTHGAGAQQNERVASPKEANLSIELDELPGRDSQDSFWEVSYQLRIADQEAFINWSESGENPKEQDRLGALMSKGSFTRHDLSRPENSRFHVTVPLTGELLERFSNAAQRKQYVWMDGVLHIHDAKLGRDFVTNLSATWGPKRFGGGVYNVHVQLSQEGELHWSSDNGAQNGQRVVRRP